MDKRNSLSNLPFILVTGFLGSGKTTLLKRFLNHFADEQKIAVIQNEFANANVDGQELKDTGKSFEIVEINKGSVFCVCLLSSFIQSLSDLMDSCQPDAIILEATGLADPIAIGQLLTAKELGRRLHLAHVWCVVDSISFLEMQPQVQRLTHQVRIADTIIINKTDCVSQERLEKTEERLVELNPHAERIRASFCDLPYASLNEAFLQKTNPGENRSNQEDFQTCGPPPISSAVLRTTRLVSREGLGLLLQRYEKFAYRIKGYVNLTNQTVVSVQSCFGQTTIQIIKKEPGPTELIALGPQVDQQKFTSMFNEMVK